MNAAFALISLQLADFILNGHAFAPSSFVTNPRHGYFKSSQQQKQKHHGLLSTSSDENMERLQSIANELNEAIAKCQPEFIKTCKVKVGVSPNKHRLGLIATEGIKKGDVALAMPYDEQIILTPELSLKVFKGILPEGYDGWTGDNGILSMLLLNELAKTATDGKSGIKEPVRKSEASGLINAWMKSLPTRTEMANLHPIMWDEDDQELLQSSSTKKMYRILDDIDEDANWLNEKVWSLDREKFPETVNLDGEEYACFSSAGFSWAMSVVTSRSYFVDGTSRLVPFMDMANHDDLGVEEVRSGFMGTFGTTKGVEFRTGKVREYKKDDEVFVSYGPKSAAEYCLDHGFVPKKMKEMTTSVAELTFEVDQEDRFYDDKLDILEFETYDSAPMEPSQSFDLVSELGRDGEPDPAMIQFLRLVNLGTKDAFLLESVFRRDIWGFMSLPVSEINERDVLETIVTSCTNALKDMEAMENAYDEEKDVSCPSNICALIKESETRALSRTLEYVSREKEALDLKEYYQERRLKDLGLDSEWNPDESTGVYPDDEDELSFGQTRAPGGLDW